MFNYTLEYKDGVTSLMINETHFLVRNIFVYAELGVRGNVLCGTIDTASPQDIKNIWNVYKARLQHQLALVQKEHDYISAEIKRAGEY